MKPRHNKSKDFLTKSLLSLLLISVLFSGFPLDTLLSKIGNQNIIKGRIVDNFGIPEASAVATPNGFLLKGRNTGASNFMYLTLTNPDTYGSETSAGLTSSSSGLAFVRSKAAPTRNEVISGEIRVDGRLDVVRNTDTTFVADWNVTGVAAAMTCDATAGSCWRPFDVSYEQKQGRGMVAYAKNANAGTVYYRLYDGSSWSSEQSLSVTSSTGVPKWIRLVAEGEQLTATRSNRILLLMMDANNDIFAAVWSGSAWGNQSVISTSTSVIHSQTFDGAWESSSGNAVVVYAEGTANSTTPFRYKKFINSTSTWDSAGTTIGTWTTSIGRWATIASNPLSTSNLLGIILQASDVTTITTSAQIRAFTLNGTTVTAGTAQTTSESQINKASSVAFEKLSGDAMFVYSTDGGADVSAYQAYTGSFGTATDLPGAMGDDTNSLDLFGSPNSNEVRLVGSNIDKGIQSHRYTGSAWNAAYSAALGTAVFPGGTNANAESIAASYVWRPYSPWARNWRWDSDTANATPGSGDWYAAENTATNITSTTTLRLRYQFAELGSGTQNLVAQASARKKLQYATADPDASGTTWTDVDAQAGGGIWRYANCSAGTDDSAIPSTVLTGSTATGDFIENGASTAQTVTHSGSAVLEQDYCIQANSASATTYYFRVFDADQNVPVFRQQTVNTAGTAETPCAGSTACTYPSLTVSSATTYGQSGFRLYANQDNIDPGSALAAANTSATLASSSTPFRLRMLVHNNNAATAINGQSFKLQVGAKGAACSSASYSDVGPSATFDYSDNASVSNLATISASTAGDPTHSSDVVKLQTYVDVAGNFSNSVTAIPSSNDAEWDFSLVPTGTAAASTAYCFRIVTSAGGTLASYTYGEVTTGIAGITVSGTLYSDQGTTVINCSSSNHTVALKVNGTGSYSNTCTAAGGTYSIGSIVVNAGDVVTVYMDGHADDGVVITKTADGSSNITLNIYKDTVIVRHENGAATTNINMKVICSSGCTNTDADIPFTADGSNNITVSANTELLVWTGKTYTPGANVTTPKLEIQSSATYTGGSETLTLTGAGTSGTCTSSSQIPLCISGTFTAPTTTVFNTTTASNIPLTTFNNLSLTPAGTVTYTLGTGAGTLAVNGTLTVGNGSNALTLDNGSNNPTINVTGSLSVAAAAIFSGSGTGTITVTQDVSGAGTINFSAGTFEQRIGVARNFGTTSGSNNWTFNNLTFSNSTAGGLTVTTETGGSGTITVSGVLSIGKTGDTGATTLNAGNRTWTLSSTGTPLVFNASGVLSGSSSTFAYTGDGATATASTGYNNLQFAPGGSSATVLGAGTYTIAGTLTVGNGTNAGATAATNNPTINVTGTAIIASGAVLATGNNPMNFSSSLTVNGTLSGSGSGTITVNGAVAGTGTINISGNTFEQRVGAAANFATTSGSNNWTFNNLTFSNSTGGGLTVTTQTGGSGTITVSGVLSIGKTGDTGATTLNAGNRTWILSGTGGAPLAILSSPAGVLTASTSDFQFTGNNGGGDTTIPVATYYSLTLGGGVAENYTIGSSTVTVSGNLTVNANGTLIGTGTLTVNRDVVGAGTINLTGGTFEQRIAASQNFGTSSGTNNWTFNNLTFSNSHASTTFTVTTQNGTGGITVTGDMLIGKGGDTAATTLTGADRTWTLRGGLTIANNSVYTKNTATLKFAKGSAQTVTDNNTTKQDLGAVQISVNGTDTTLNLGSSIKATSLVVDASQILTLGSNTLELTGSGTPLTLSGSLDIGAGPYTGTVQYTGANPTITSATYNHLIIGNASANSYTLPGGGLTLRGNLTVSSGVSAITKGGTITFAGGTSQSITDNTGTKLDVGAVQISVNGSNSTLSLGSSVRVTSAIIDASQFMSLGGSNTLFITGSGTGVSRPLKKDAIGTFTQSTGTVEYLGDGNTEIENTTYYNLNIKPTITAARVYTGPAALTVTNNMDINPTSAGTLNLTLNLAGTTNITGSLTIQKTGANTSATLDTTSAGNYALSASSINIDTGATLTANNSTITITGTGTPFVVTGTFTPGGSTVTYTNNSGATLAATTYYNLYVAPTSIPTFNFNSGTTTVNNDLTIGNGTNGVTANTTANNPTVNVLGNLAVASTASLIGSGTGTITVNGNVSGAGTINLTAGSFVQSVASAKNFGTTSGSNNWTFNNLTFTASPSSTITIQTGSGSITAGNILTISANTTLDAANRTIILSANSGTPLVISGVFTPSTSTVQYTGSAANVTATTYSSLTLGGTGTYTMPASNLTLRGNLVVTSGASVTKGAGTIIFASGSTQTFTDNNGTKQDIGAVRVSVNGTNTTLNLGSSVKATSLLVDASQTFSHNGTKTLTLTGSGTAGSRPLINNGTFTASTGTLEFIGTSSTDIGSDVTYSNLSIIPAAAVTYTLGTAASQTITIGSTLVVGDGTNTVTVNANTYDPIVNMTGVMTIAANAVYVSSSSSNLVVDGTLTNNGTFTHSNGTVVYNSNVNPNGTVNGSSDTTFYNFSAVAQTGIPMTLKFKTAGFTGFDGLLTLTGLHNNKINVESVTDTTQWIIKLLGTSSVTYISLKDSGCHGSTLQIIPINSNKLTNVGTCWALPSHGGGGGSVAFAPAGGEGSGSGGGTTGGTGQGGSGSGYGSTGGGSGSSGGTTGGTGGGGGGGAAP